MKNKKAFTLIELLVVIGIIGLLATMSIIALNTARARARDAKRVADIKQIETALELHYEENIGYPDELDDLSPAYMAIVPQSPTPADGNGTCTDVNNKYDYEPTDDGNGYTLTFCLGSDTGNLKAGVNTVTKELNN